LDLGIRDRVALVTGAGRGIGLEIGKTLAEEGVRVAVNDLFEDRAQEGAQEIAKAGGTAIGVAGDVTDNDSVGAMVKRVVEDFGAVDILVNNAGIPAVTTDAVPSTGGFFATSDRAQWDRTMGLITYGVMNCSRAVIEGMAERRWGGL
jgi:3-oxoacyl-[acyl-carrier protein] reductase